MNQPASLVAGSEEPARFTVEEFMDLATRGPLADMPGKIELVEGVIVRMSPAHYPHFSIQRQLFVKLYELMKGRDDGVLVGQELTVRIGPATVRDPDIAIFRDPGDIKGIVDADALLMVAEVADSSLAHDLGAKRLGYAAAGVPVYWVADVEARVVHVMTEPEDGDYARRRVVRFGEPLAVPGTDATIALD